MEIRLATLSDLNACLSLDHGCETDHVWQMQDRRSKLRVSVTFDIVRLPRPMRTQYPRDVEQLVHNWQRGEGFFVAEVDGEVRGYVDTVAQPWQSLGWVMNLAVDRGFRERRIGIALLGQARQWVREQGLLSLMVEATTKNYPALSLYQKLGFQFCGFNDHYYLNRDIALFFVQSVR
jgi:ribosomal protein S18 acetylase RimI-like enzyme